MTKAILRVALLVLSCAAASWPVITGLGMLLISAVFCDRGPLSHCLKMGLDFLGVGLSFAIWPLPAILALIMEMMGRDVRWLRRYLVIYPFIVLGLCAALYALVRSFHMELFATKAYAGYGLLAVCAFFYVVADRRDRAVARESGPG